jgi:hypothetical protein
LRKSGHRQVVSVRAMAGLAVKGSAVGGNRRTGGEIRKQESAKRTRRGGGNAKEKDVAEEVRPASATIRSGTTPPGAQAEISSRTPLGSAGGVSFQYNSGVLPKGKSDGVPSNVDVNGETFNSNGPDTVLSGDRYEFCRKVGKLAGGQMAAVDLIGYVRTELFPKLKFFMDKRQLVFSGERGTICDLICRGMSVGDGRAAEWWETYKLLILKTLNSKRADVTAAIKRTFLSK